MWLPNLDGGVHTAKLRGKEVMRMEIRQWNILIDTLERRAESGIQPTETAKLILFLRAMQALVTSVDNIASALRDRKS